MVHGVLSTLLADCENTDPTVINSKTNKTSNETKFFFMEIPSHIKFMEHTFHLVIGNITPRKMSRAYEFIMHWYSKN